MLIPSTGRSALLLLIASPLLLSAAPQDLRDFDDFIRHVRTEAESGHPERIADCFAPLIVAEDGCDPVPFGDAFGYDAQRFGWAQLGRDIARVADGFALVNAAGTMVNLALNQVPAAANQTADTYIDNCKKQQRLTGEYKRLTMPSVIRWAWVGGRIQDLEDWWR